MHPLQTNLLRLCDTHHGRLPLKLRQLARDLGENHPQTVKYHLLQLEEKGLIAIDPDREEVIRIAGAPTGSAYANLPIMGSANCGTPAALADNEVEGLMKVSRGLLPAVDVAALFVVRAHGSSMDAAEIDGKNIEDGDYVVVERRDDPPANREVIVSLIDGYANIKCFFRQEDEIVLYSLSRKDYPPIVIRAGDPYLVAGRVVKVIKTPRLA